MNRQQTTTELKKLLAILKAEVALETAASFSDIKTALAEIILREPVSTALNLPNLVSLNAAEKRNFPAIDLADDSTRTGIQVTATSDLGKIKHTVNTFIEHKLYERFDKLFMLLLSDKKKYRTNLSKLSDGSFEFTKDHVLDLNDLFAKLTECADLAALRRVTQTLRANLVGDSILDSIREQSTQTDVLHVNLLPIRIPESLYIARLTLDKKAIRVLIPKRRYRYDRDYVMALLAHHDHEFGRDFSCHEGSLLSFRPLEDAGLNKLGIIDEGTIEPIDPPSYFGASLDTEIQFRFLLRLSLQSALRGHHIFWQHEEKMFAFGPSDDKPIRAEVWLGQKKATRVVYKVMPPKDDNARPIHKHFAFRVQFKCVEGNWFLVIDPKWLFSWDRYHKSFAHPRLAALTAQRERNAQIYQHTRFISWYLTNCLQVDEYSLRFDKNIVVVGGSTFEDKDWTGTHESD